MGAHCGLWQRERCWLPCAKGGVHGGQVRAGLAWACGRRRRGRAHRCRVTSFAFFMELFMKSMARFKSCAKGWLLDRLVELVVVVEVAGYGVWFRSNMRTVTQSQ